MASAEDENWVLVEQLGQKALKGTKGPGEVGLAMRAGLEAQGTTAWFTNFEALRAFGILNEAELGASSARDGSFLTTLVRPSTQADQDTGR